MKHSISLLLALLLSTAATQAQPVFIDFFGDDYHPGIGYRINDGQVIDTDGSPRSDVYAKSEGMPLTIWPCKNSRLSITWRSS